MLKAKDTVQVSVITARICLGCNTMQTWAMEVSCPPKGPTDCMSALPRKIVQTRDTAMTSRSQVLSPVLYLLLLLASSY